MNQEQEEQKPIISNVRTIVTTQPIIIISEHPGNKSQVLKELTDKYEELKRDEKTIKDWICDNDKMHTFRINNMHHTRKRLKRSKSVPKHLKEAEYAIFDSGIQESTQHFNAWVHEVSDKLRQIQAQRKEVSVLIHNIQRHL